MQHAMPRKLQVLMWIVVVHKLASFQDLLHFRVTFYDMKETCNRQIVKSHQQQAQALQSVLAPTLPKGSGGTKNGRLRLQYTDGNGSKITR